MKALYKAGRGEGSIYLTDRPMPTADEINNVLVKVHAAAVCGMDNGIYKDRFPCTPPFIMGHEMVGTVESVCPGTDAGSVRPGDRVVCEPHMYACGCCRPCKMGLPQFCADKRSLGIHRDGAFTSYVAVPARYLHRVPEGVGEYEACLAEPMSIVMGNFGVPIMEEHVKTAVVIGAGQVGQLGIYVAKNCGAENVILSGVARDHEFRFDVAKKLGADMVFANSDCDVAEKVLELTDGVGADMVLEASGAEAGINSAFKMIKEGGLISVMGGTKRDSVALNWDVCLQKAVRLHFHMFSNYRYMDDTLQMMAKSDRELSAMITGIYELDDWQSAFRDIAAKKSIKNIIRIPE